MENEIKVGDDDSSVLGFAHSIYTVAPVWGRGLHVCFLWEKGKINLIYLVPGCEVVSEKTNEPAILTAAFIGD